MLIIDADMPGEGKTVWRSVGIAEKETGKMIDRMQEGHGT